MSLSVEAISLSSKEELSPLMTEYRLGRYCADWTLDIQSARRLELETIYAYLQKNSQTCWWAKWEGQVTGLLGLRKLEWDTNFWKKECASIDKCYAAGGEVDQEFIIDQLLDTVELWCRDNRIQFISARPDTCDLPFIHALEHHGYRYIETTCTNTYDIRNVPFPLPEGCRMRPPLPGERDVLADMVADAFVTHRFYADPRFPRAMVDEMYRQWVINGLESPEWTTIVYEDHAKPRGFFIYRLEDLTPYFGLRFAKWRMGVLSTANRGKGSGIPLFQGAMEYVRDCVDIVDSGLSIRNVRSFNLHNKLNFRIVHFAATYHKWFD